MKMIKTGHGVYAIHGTPYQVCKRQSRWQVWFRGSLVSKGHKTRKDALEYLKGHGQLSASMGYV